MYFCCLRDFPACEGSSLCLFELLVSEPCYNPAVLLQTILHKDCFLLQIIISYSCKTLKALTHFLDCTCMFPKIPDDVFFFFFFAIALMLKVDVISKNIYI